MPSAKLIRMLPWATPGPLHKCYRLKIVTRDSSPIILGAFATLGMILVAFGIFSVMAYTVSLQTRNIGIRMALGADRAHIIRRVLNSGLALISLGTIVGTLTALALTRLIASHIWGVSTQDPAHLFSSAHVDARRSDCSALCCPPVAPAKLTQWSSCGMNSQSRPEVLGVGGKCREMPVPTPESLDASG